MKRFFAFLLAMCLVMGIFAQNSKLSYQAVVRNSANELVTNANITVDLSIANSISGDAVFSEKHTLTTNQNGLVSLMIGNGSNQTGSMSNVTWATAYITSDYTLPGGTHVINTVPVSAVPYALYADTVNEQSLANYLTSHHYATTADVPAQVNAAALCDSVDDCILGKVDARHYLTSDSTVIGNMQNGIAINIANITTLQSGLGSAIDKEKNDSLILAGRINTLESTSMDCDDVKSCIKDTLSKYTTTDELTILLQQLADRLAAQDAKIDTLRHLVDSLTKHTPGVTTTSVTSIRHNSATCGGNVTADGGYSVLARGVCWSTSPNPVFNDSHVSCGDGMGAFSGQLTGLEANTTYYVRAYAVNSVGTAYGNQVSFTTAQDGQPCPGAATVTDYDGNTYNTVKIGSQCWMKENLKTTRYADGTSISRGSSTSTTTAYRYYPDNNSSNVSTYGYLYNWKAVMRNSSSSSSNPSGVQGVCPTGWHVPSDAEWTQLTTYVKSRPEYVCDGCSGTDDEWETSCIAKALASQSGWNSSSSTCTVGNNPSANNATGFSAVPAGGYFGGFDHFGGLASFWSATQYDSGSAYYRNLNYNNANVSRNSYYKLDGLSVRCLRD